MEADLRSSETASPPHTTDRAEPREIKELRQELDDLTSAVERLAYEVRRNRENEAHEREKLVLRLENELLKFEHRIPGKIDPDPKGEE